MPTPPARIVSLVPSLTELVFWLGRGDCMVGRTRFCIEPKESVGRIPAVGGTKDPRVDVIVALKPDLVLANKEENRREDVQTLEQAGLRVLLTDPNTVGEAVGMIRLLGGLLDAPAATASLVADIESAIAEPGPARPQRVLVPVWHRPLMALGARSYGHDLIQVAGAVNVLADRERYPAISVDEASRLKPNLILLPDEPYRFSNKHVAEYSAIAPARIVDGKMLWWYGPRIPGAIRALRQIFGEERASGS